MATKTIIRENKIETILKELQTIKNQLDKFLLLIPEEKLKEYTNASQIKKAYSKALKNFPPG